MALTAAQRAAVSRRTTATSRARLRNRFLGMPSTTGGVYGGGPQNLGRGNLAQGLGPGGRPVPHPAIVGTTPGRAPVAPTGANGAVGRPTAQFIPDASYLAQAAQAQFQRQTQLDQIKAEHDAAVGTYAEGQRRLMEGVSQQRQDVKEGANKQGLFYSGQLGKRLGDLETQIARQRADAQGQFDAQDRAREAARTAIMQGAPLEEAAMKAEAVQRQLDRDQAAAQANALAPTPVPAARPIVKPKPKPKKKRRRR